MQQAPTSTTRTSRPAATATMALLLGVTILGAFAGGPASAQIIYLTAAGGDSTYGWTFPEGSEPDAVLADPAGDVNTQAGPAPGAAIPDGTILQALDLTGFEVHEIDEEILLLRISVAELDPAQFTREHSVDIPSYTITFTIGAVQHRVYGWVQAYCDDPATPVCEPYTNPALHFQAGLEHAAIDGDYTMDGTTPTRVDTDANTLEVLLPRWALYRSGSGTSHPLAGDKVTDVTVTSRLGFSLMGGDTETAFGASDQLPDDGPAALLHTLDHHSLGSMVRIALAGTSDEDEPVDPFTTGSGGPLSPRETRIDVDLDRAPRVPIEVHNGFGRGVLVVPEVTLHGAPGGLSAKVVESLSVPSDETRRFDLVLTGNATIDPADPLRATVSVHTLGTGTTYMDRFDILIRDAAALTSDSNRLYLHTIGEQSIGDLPTTMFTFVEGILNTREDDPQDNGIGATLGIGCICGDRVDEWNSESALLEPLALDPDANVTLHITIEAPVAGVLQFEPNLFHADTHVAGRETLLELAQGSNTFDIAMGLSGDATELAASDTAFLLDLFSAFRPAVDVPLTELSNLAHEVNPRLVTDGATWLELPIIDRAERYAGVDHLAVDLQRGYEAVQYVNPGRAALWNVTILNQGAEADTVTLAPAADATGWKTETRPGKSFRPRQRDPIPRRARQGRPRHARTKPRHRRLGARGAARLRAPPPLRLTIGTTAQPRRRASLSRPMGKRNTISFSYHKGLERANGRFTADEPDHRVRHRPRCPLAPGSAHADPGPGHPPAPAGPRGHQLGLDLPRWPGGTRDHR